MVCMVTRLRILLSCLLVVSLGGCSGGNQAGSHPDASAVAGGSGGSAGTGGGGTGGQSATATSPAPGVCVPGASVACACVTGQQGAQTCTSAGTFAACLCAVPPVDAGGSGGADGAVTSPSDDVAAVGGSGGFSGTDGGGGGPVVDAAADQRVDVPAAPDVFPYAAAEAGAGGDTSGTTPAILSFTASPATISAGKSSTLNWTVTRSALRIEGAEPPHRSSAGPAWVGRSLLKA
jgi:hypothetical protein